MKTNYLRIKIPLLIIMTLFFFTGFRVYSQSNYLSFANPISAFYIGGWASWKSNPQLSPEMKNTYHLADSILEISPVAMVRMINPDRSGTELVFIRKPSGKIRAFQSLIDKEDYLILCSRGVEEPCACKNSATLYIYLPEPNLLKMVQKAFSFSIKRNLISDLNKYAELNLSKEDFENACRVLNAIGDS